ncbi:MAG: hypothetical protein UT30_C0001G0016 [Candidatus Uhrbacteria bacterium GW2011_GWF2_39_13]|uniref:EfeO-type cupredoxin-like domain-containing protein n=1 Tax=Candidatus Uhrbacteria bacterium GW2011_GWF2_39_13 TaxID=1618995 RepID=A0A0G0QTW1_9BACT|nr:MAG: hypothetical protein UT30_C0001G0016 [Candidatus Uhrbacteria bacterium GW2011_GWF2_39_13]HAU66340.1 hypothetical protein [Candidatus Uhrbacteria bacterium]
MKYLLSLLLAVILVGAGCTRATNVETQTSQNRQEQEQTDPKIEGSSDEDVTQTETEAAIEIETDNGNLEVTKNTTTQVEEDGIPVTEVTLGTTSDTTMSMEAGNYFFTPNTITTAPGSKVKITFAKNVGFHTFVIDAIDLNFSINEGESLLFTAPSEPGSYTFYCDVGSHQSFGMEGTLIVK